jgi:hypothetical protein
MGHGFLIGDVLSHHAVVGAFLGDKKPPGLDIRWSVDRLDKRPLVKMVYSM